MALEITCPNCQKRYIVPDKHAGKTTRCKNCATLIPIPETSAGPVCSICGTATDDVVEHGGAILCRSCMIKEVAGRSAPAAAASARARSAPAQPAAPVPVPYPPKRVRWVKVVILNLVVLGALAGGLYLYFHFQSSELTDLMVEAKKGAQSGDLHAASVRFDALFDRVNEGQVPRSIMPALDESMAQWQELIRTAIHSADRQAQDGRPVEAARQYLQVKRLSDDGLVPQPMTDEVAAALSRYRRVYLDLIDDADRHVRGNDFLKASQSYRALQDLAAAVVVPPEVKRQVSDALDDAWPQLYRNQIRRAQESAQAGDKEAACRLYRPLLSEKGLTVPASIAEDLKRAKTDALRLCPDLAGV